MPTKEVAVRHFLTDWKNGRSLSGRFALALSLVAVVVAMSGTAIAATGGSFILGRVNAEKTMSSLKNTAGIPLSLKALSGFAPLAVNSSEKVSQLNADLLDGVDSSQFVRTTDTSQFVRTTDNGGVYETFPDASLTSPAGGLIGFFNVPPGSWSLELYSNIASKQPPYRWNGPCLNCDQVDYPYHLTVVCSLIDSNSFAYTVYHSVLTKFKFDGLNGTIWSTLNFTSAINYPTGTLLTLRCGVTMPDESDATIGPDNIAMHATRITAVQVSGFANGHL
ncbi:MAG: hypothetical protein NT160_08635 [Actinobacteria bacterium]|nr:hypothetical protein [Actinomycetota bacterium]